MRNILAIFFTVLIVGLMGYTFFQGKAFQGGEAGNIIEDIKYINTPQNSNENTQVI